MKKTIEEIWNGNIRPIERLGKNNREIKELLHLIEYNRERLEKELGENKTDILEKYTDCFEEYIVLLAEEAFCEGFCIGAKLTAEALI